MYSYTWTTDFATPATPTGLAVTANTESIALVATVDASADAYHYEYLWEAQAGDDDWAEVGRTADPSFTYYLAHLNQETRLRVSDSNGALYSDTTEAAATLVFARWALTQVDGNDDFIRELFGVRPTGTTDYPLDQTVLQPASGGDGDTQLPIVFTGQWQGERVGFEMQVRPVDRAIVTTLRKAALEPVGSIALKSPYGPVYLVQIANPIQLTALGGGQQVFRFAAIRVA